MKRASCLPLALWRWSCLSVCVAMLACEGSEGSAARSPEVEPLADASPGDGGGAPDDAGAPSAVDAGSQDALATPKDGGHTPPSSGDAAQVSVQASRREIVDHSAWRRIDPSMDPFDDQPATVVCDASATLPELFGGVIAYGIDTAFCNYATVTQRTTSAVALGETIAVRVAHFALDAPEASTAHVVVRVDELVLLDEQIPIPSDSQVLVRSLVAPRAIRAGADAYFHVHNHGANSYALISVSAGPLAAAPNPSSSPRE